MAGKITEMTTATTVLEADLLEMMQSGNNLSVSRKLLLQGQGTAADGDMLRYNSQLATPAYETMNPRWRKLLAGTDFTTTPIPSTSTITVSAGTVSRAPAGTPIKYNIGGSDLYGIVTISTGTTLTISGVSLGTGSLTALYLGTPDCIRYVTIPVHSAGTIAEIAAGTPATSLGYSPTLNTALVSNLKWLSGPAACVNFSMSASTVYGTVKPKINVRVNGTVISTMDSNLGVVITAASTWYEPTAATITSAYAVTYGQTVDLYCTLAGTGTPGMNLSAVLVFVLA